MNRKEFLNEVERRLHGLPAEDISKALDYFGEMIDDRTEDGMSEEEAVAEIGTAQEAAEGILMELPLKKVVRARGTPRRALKAWEIVLIALGSPVWLPLLLAALVLVLTLYILMWTVVVVLYCVDIALFAAGIGGTAFGIAYVVSAKLPGGIMLIGAGAACLGMAMLALSGCNLTAVGMAKLSRAIGRRIKSIFVKRREA